jgi:membrane protein implicated in regulation of membrane protease activity
MDAFLDWLRENPPSAWLGLAILLGLAEMFSLDLILGMLALGALVGLLSSALGAGLVLSSLLAAAGAVAGLAVVRPRLAQRLHTGPELVLGHKRLIGEQGRVLERITSLEPGRVKVSGEEWTARPYDETLTIEPGEKIEVYEIRGATAYVHPIPSIES